MIKLLRPKYFFFGVLLGFLTCCIAGHYVSTKARFQDFARFFPAITPQSHYYPTANELLATARHDVSHDKILVLIGGNSVFRGVGQNPSELWSLQLQKLLGDKFKVLNYAIDSATMNSFGGVSFRMLSEEYPKIIFVTTTLPLPAGPIDGSEPYSYLFWDAYYKNLFHPDENIKKTIDHVRKNQLSTAKGAEQHLLSFLDSFFYFRNLWNWVGYHYAFTLRSTYIQYKLFKPRSRYTNQYDKDLQKHIDAHMKDPEKYKSFQKLALSELTTTINRYFDFSKTPPQPNELAFTNEIQNFDESFPRRDHAKILCVIVDRNPQYLSILPKKLQIAQKKIINRARSMLERTGYHAIGVGQDFSSDDYGDALHLSTSGGKKLAAQIAKEVKHIAETNGYYNPKFGS